MRASRKPPARAACLSWSVIPTYFANISDIPYAVGKPKFAATENSPAAGVQCLDREYTCSYRPSRRGGIRREAKRHGFRYVSAVAPTFQLLQTGSPGPLPRLARDHNDTSRGEEASTSQCSTTLADQVSGIHDPGNLINLLAPFHGIQNLNLPSGVSGEDNLTLVPENEDDSELTAPSIRLYASDDEILNAYFIYIHPFLPILPPSMSSQHHDNPIASASISQNFLAGDSMNRDTLLPHWPTTALTLTISAILVLVPIPGKTSPFPHSNMSLRRSQAHLFAKEALERADSELERNIRASSQTNGAFGESISSTEVSRLQPILALSLLALYEYCQRASFSRMRSRANQAVTAAMDLSLHCLDHTSTEAERRTWWIASPIISISDQRITTPFPSSSPESWSLLLEAEQSFISVLQTSNYIEGIRTSTPSSDTHGNIQLLDSNLIALMKRSSCLPRHTPSGSVDTTAVQNMKTISNLFIHCARIRLHRARAFKEIPMFLGRYCGLASIDERDTNSAFNPSRFQNLDAVFPFTENDSSLICLKSALAISRGLENTPVSLAKPSTGRPHRIGAEKAMTDNGLGSFILPFFICSAMQSSYVLLMCHYRLRAALVSGDIAPFRYLFNTGLEADSEVQEAERLMREIRQGLDSIVHGLEGAQMFEGVSGMCKEIHIACRSAFLDGNQYL